jgi:hypothetical protein
MKDWYFYQEKGKTVGPLNVDDIKGRIKDGRIRIFDLIYRDGEETWKMALEHSSLRTEFKSTALANLKDRPWVCLQRKTPDSLEFITTGPYTTDEIRQHLQTGLVSYSDYAWKDDLSEWKRIGALEEFNRRVRSSAAVPPVPMVPQDSSIDLLKNVLELRKQKDGHTGTSKVERRDPTRSSSIPLGSIPSAPPEGRTRTASRAPTNTDTGGKPPPPPPSKGVPVPAVSNSVATPPQSKTRSARREEAAAASASAAAPEQEPRRSRIRFDWSLVVVLTLLLTGMVLIVSRFVISRGAVPVPAPEAATPPAVEKTAPEPAAKPSQTVVDTSPPVEDLAETQTPEEPEPEPEEKPAAPKPSPIPSHAPTTLHLAVQSGAQPRLEIRTDGSPDFPVFVQILAPAGQVAENGSFYRFMRLRPNAERSKPVVMPVIKYPAGYYTIRVEIQNLHKEAKFKVGVSDPNFKPALNRQRKAWAYAVWKERLALFKLAQTLEKQVAAAVPSKKFTGHGWEPLIDLKRGSGGKYLMFDDWWELHQIATDAKAGATAAVAGRAQHERERLAGFSVWK